MILFLSIVYSWKERTAYIIKESNTERYVTRSGGIIRSVPGNNLSEVADAYYAVEIINNNGKYSFSFCDKLLSTKANDPGIVVSGNDTWELIPTGKGYKLKSNKNDKCLVKLDSYDSKGKGFYMNSKDCNSTLPNKFEFFEMGDIDFYCKKDAESICSRYNYVMEDMHHEIEHHHDHFGNHHERMNEHIDLTH